MKADALLRYKKTLKNPITEHMNREFENLNKKSVTRVYEFRDKKATMPVLQSSSQLNNLFPSSQNENN